MKPTSLSIVLIFLLFQAGHSLPGKFFSSDLDLSNSMITKIAQDGDGFIWIATEDGLNRFDGLNFRIYRHVPNSGFSLTSNFVRTLHVDRRGRLWVGCINGLLLYNHEKDHFQEIYMYRDTMRLRPHVTSIIETNHGNMLIATSGQGLIVIKNGTYEGHADMNIIPRLSSEFLECVFEDFYGRLWIGTENEGVNVFLPATNELRVFRYEQGKSGALTSNYITSIIEDHQRNILIGTANGGLNRFVEHENRFIQVAAASPGRHPLPIRSLYADRNNNIWVGTSGLGIWKLPAHGAALEQHHITHSRFEANRSRIHAITQDNEGNMWMGVFMKGAIMIPGRANNFNTLTYQQFGEYTIGSGSIMAIAQDNKNQVWVGTDTDGIYQIRHHTGQVRHFQVNSQRADALPVSITSLVFDQRGTMWVGTALEGFFSFNPATGANRFFKNQPMNPNSLSNDKVQALLADRRGYIWIGTSGGGLNRFDPATGDFTRFLHNPTDPNTICNNWVNKIFEDSEGLIWIATYNRVSVFDPNRNNFRTLSTTNGLIPNNIAYFIIEDSQGQIWIGTNEGLAVYNKTTGTSRFITTNDGLSNNVVTAILEGNDNQMWISTHNGISNFNPSDSSFINYFVHDGLQGNEFRRNSALRNSDGELFFGGINGLTWFVPSKIIRENQIPQVYLTELVLLNQPVQIGEKINGRIILQKSIERTDTLSLPWRNNNFSIEFSTIGFSNPERFTYQYRLLGFDKNWISTGTTNRRATFTNLDPGTYTFEVRAVDGLNFSQTRILTVRILPPWYATWWFKVIYGILGALLIFGLYRYIKNRIKFRQELLHHENQERMNQAKLRFFTNISHEIRTPLTLIAGPLDKLLSENVGTAQKKSFQLMATNIQRLMRLVNQLLDVGKIEKGQLLLSYAQTDLVKFVFGIMEAFQYLADTKEIKLQFSKPFDELQVWIDPNNFDKVIYNVLYNAIKFTPKGGEIEVHLRTTKNPDNEGFLKEYAEITISDTGPGIEEHNIDKIFDRFYQGSNHPNSKSGTGIGLHLARTLVEMQQGKIFARNRTSRSGSVFYIQIPLGHTHVTNVQISQQAGQRNLPDWTEANFELPEVFNEIEDHQVSEIKARKKTKFKILIADDDNPMRQYLKQELKDYYKIFECSNGKDALELVHQQKPDLILSDVVMPVMDGVVLCRKLKSNPATSHLPIVLITSKAQNEDLLSALDVGADAYFVKPFNLELLKRNISNLLNNRERIKIKYSPGGNILVEEQKVSSADDALMNRIMLIIESRLSDPRLNAEDLSKAVGMSRVHLFRKLKKITGQSPSDFIKNIRLQKAAQLLEGNKGFIKEIAFDVGFSSLSYFSRCFHEFYGVKPSEYSNEKSEFQARMEVSSK
jgi:signal transduction histidine kinase/ligand-binding sensor domain-containing protein/CheY-like chemotaxis protein/AraC-like DNA-binding protein